MWLFLISADRCSSWSLPGVHAGVTKQSQRSAKANRPEKPKKQEKQENPYRDGFAHSVRS